MRLLILSLLLGGCAMQPGGNREARAANGNDYRAQVHTDLAANYYSRGQLAVALEELTRATHADAGYAPAYNMLGLVNGELHEDQRAEMNFRRAIELSPQLSEARNNFGLFLCQRKRMQEAHLQFETALADPLYATPEKALSNAGACSLEEGDVAGAERYFQRATKQAPNHASAQLGLAEVLFRQGHWLAARGQLRRLSEQTELNAQGLWLGLRIERRPGDHEAEANYDAQLHRRYPESMQTQWLTIGQYDQVGSLL